MPMHEKVPTHRSESGVTRTEEARGRLSPATCFQNREVMGAAFDAARRLYREVTSPPTEGFDLVAKELAQCNPKLRDVDRKSVVNLRFVRELKQSGFLKSLKEH